MRRISNEQARLIREVVAEHTVGYPPAALEKDLHLTAILRALSLQTNQHLNLVFGGGTSLVKGYRLFDRMSEDLDFKFQIEETASKSKLRKLIAKYRGNLYSLVESLGYKVVNAESNNEYRHFVFDLSYENAFDPIVSLRPNLKLEFYYGQLIAPSTIQPISSLLDISLNTAQAGFDMQCINMNQTGGEKVIGLLNRFYSAQNNENTRLIRHMHDVYFITKSGRDIFQITDLFPKILDEELKRYANRLSALVRDPSGYLTKNLEILVADQNLSSLYNQFVNELTLSSAPSMEEARNSFVELASACIKSIRSC